MFVSAFVVSLLAWSALIVTVRSVRTAVQHTSLVAASWWLVAAGLAACLMTTADLLCRLWTGQTADYGWLGIAILLLCSPIAVLGSRRPGVKIWSVFILLPMIVVLTWPIWTMLLQGGEPRGLQLETPTVVGFCLVLLMGAGNYLGTRHSASCVLYMMGTALVFATCIGRSMMSDAIVPGIRLLAMILLAASAFIAVRGRIRCQEIHRVNRLWQDFRNLFGNVWALRMVERINALAAHEHWNTRLSYDGFPETSDGRLMSNGPEIESACRWLFRRFVDAAWIEARLPLGANGTDSESDPA